MSHTKNKSGSPRFKVGDKVRVKSGVSDPDFPDMPLGGWTGTVTEIIEHEGQINCVFKLDERTLTSIHPIYRKRCERDGLELEIDGLGEEDLEPDDGTPVPIEQPTPDHDAAAVGEGPGRSGPHGLRADPRRSAPRGQPTRPSSTYYRYLSANLKFPFKASVREAGGLVKASRDAAHRHRAAATGGVRDR